MMQELRRLRPDAAALDRWRRPRAQGVPVADKAACRALGAQAREYAESWASKRMAESLAALYASL
jgi:hypothetical protein